MKARSIKILLIPLLFFVFFLLFRLVGWAASTFDGLTFDKIVFQLQVPLEGTDPQIIQSGIQYCLYPALIFFVLLAFVLLLNANSKNVFYLNLKLLRSEADKIKSLKIWPIPFAKTICILLSVAILAAGLIKAEESFKVIDYVKSQIYPSTFIQTHYINPEKVNLQFPQKKRNLIYIYMESMESTYADTQSGGAFEQNYIPELTRLADENVNFSNNSNLGGARPVDGTQWTMGAMFAHSTGLPLKLPVGANSMSDYKDFFPGVITIGDILKANGYKNVLFIGSDATFGGRRNFFAQHGDYEINDYKSAIQNGLIPSDYYVWWGFEDQKLFAFAKDRLSKLAESDQPFNFTLLTVDTHFQDGYVCPLCRNDFSSQYANVIACSSRQVNDFVQWIQQQDFYQNTTIVLTGDHATMQQGFLSPDSPQHPRSVYDCYINAVPQISKEQTKNRQFSSLDLFPTTLASLGVKIPGDRLGMGVNLFSGEKTLMEQYGDKLSKEIDARSSFYDNTFIYSKK